LGGKCPIVVFEDANIEEAVNGVAFAAFIASGQVSVIPPAIATDCFKSTFTFSNISN
jgi:acyl-CoA reductase-like NAD-dependent aldehyde dehydrogenase